MTPEKELIATLAREGVQFTQEPSSAPYFETLQSQYPICGSKIDWDKVSGSDVVTVPTGDWERYLEAAASFLGEAMQKNMLSDELDVVVVGDSAMEAALVMKLGSLRRTVELFLEMPQHTYVFPENAEWCFVITMEGDLCFGRSPVRRPAKGT